MNANTCPKPIVQPNEVVAFIEKTAYDRGRAEREAELLQWRTGEPPEDCVYVLYKDEDSNDNIEIAWRGPYGNFLHYGTDGSGNIIVTSYIGNFYKWREVQP